MPLHDVKCSQCDHIQELFFQPSDRPNTYVCNNCDYVQKFKPLIGSTLIKMAGERPNESQLEKDASNGLF